MVVAQKLRPRTHGQAAVHRFCTPMLRPKSPGGGDDRVSGTDAERHDDIYHNDSSGFGGNADRAEMANLRLCMHTALTPGGAGVGGSRSLLKRSFIVSIKIMMS